jgi:ATP-dependent DNA helicase DinG
MEAKQTAESLLSEIIRECPKMFDETCGFMFQALGCAVFEEAAPANRYEYLARNIESGRSELIDRRRRPLRRTDEDELAILRKLKSLRVAGRGRIEVDGDTTLKVEKLRAVMYEVFREILPKYGYAVRGGQIELAERILAAIAGRGTLIAEAAVGLGKTIAYIIIAVLVKRGRLNEFWNTGYFPELSVVEWKRMPVLISTTSIALQTAIDNEVVPEISRILIENGVITTPLKSLLVKGKSHYVCEHNLHTQTRFEKKPQDQAILRSLSFDSSVIDLAEVDGLSPRIKRKICVPEKCHKNCPESETCRYRDFRDGVKGYSVDFLICNHNLLLADAKLRAEENKSVLPPYQMLVLDEAHEVLQAARSIFGTELEADAIGDITRTVLDLNFSPLTTEGTNDWRDIRDIAQRLAEKLYGQNKRLFKLEEADVRCDRHLRNIRNIISELTYALKKSYTLKSGLDEERKRSLLYGFEKLNKTLTALGSNRQNIRWFKQRDEANITLCSLPKNLSEIIHDCLWRRGIPTLFTSGTLSVGGDFSALKNSLGLNAVKRITETTQASPYDYRSNALLYISENVPFYRADGYEASLTDEVGRLIETAHGHTAVLFTSYEVMNAVYNNLGKRGLSTQYEFYKLERSTANAIDKFKASKNGVLFASGSFWEGVDVPGDALSMLIIVKLPFAVPDAVSEYERSQYEDMRSYLNEVLVPEMLIKLKQGFGRLIRTETDTGVVAILDCRANSRGAYRERVLAALPECDVTADLTKVADFFKAKKQPDYFM